MGGGGGARAVPDEWTNERKSESYGALGPLGTSVDWGKENVLRESYGPNLSSFSTWLVFLGLQHIFWSSNIFPRERIASVCFVTQKRKTAEKRSRNLFYSPADFTAAMRRPGFQVFKRDSPAMLHCLDSLIITKRWRKLADLKTPGKT